MTDVGSTTADEGDAGCGEFTTSSVFSVVALASPENIVLGGGTILLCAAGLDRSTVAPRGRVVPSGRMAFVGGSLVPQPAVISHPVNNITFAAYLNFRLEVFGISCPPCSKIWA